MISQSGSLPKSSATFMCNNGSFHQENKCPIFIGGGKQKNRLLSLTREVREHWCESCTETGLYNDQLSALIFMFGGFFLFFFAGGIEQYSCQRWAHQGRRSYTTGAHTKIFTFLWTAAVTAIQISTVLWGFILFNFTQITKSALSQSKLKKKPDIIC